MRSKNQRVPGSSPFVALRNSERRYPPKHSYFLLNLRMQNRKSSNDTVDAYMDGIL
jgi:hypothetical protein